jgi:hypothetical protein
MVEMAEMAAIPVWLAMAVREVLQGPVARAATQAIMVTMVLM